MGLCSMIPVWILAASAPPLPPPVPILTLFDAAVLGLVLGFAAVGLTVLVRAAVTSVGLDALLRTKPVGCDLCMSVWTSTALMLCWAMALGHPPGGVTAVWLVTVYCAAIGVCWIVLRKGSEMHLELPE